MLMSGGTTGTPIVSEGYNYSYESLPNDARKVVSIVWERLNDSMDNEERGVWLNEESGFNKDRMAMLFQLAIGRINSRMLQVKSYDAETYPYEYGSGMTTAVHALMVECVKHLIISYTEQPDVSSVGAPRADRSGYAGKWQGILAIVEAEFKESISGLNRQAIFQNGLGGGMIALVGNSNRAMDVARYGRPIPKTWMGF